MQNNMQDAKHLHGRTSMCTCDNAVRVCMVLLVHLDHMPPQLPILARG